MILLGTLFSLPTAETVIASSSEWSVPFFSEFALVMIGLSVGLLVFALAILYAVRKLSGAVSRVLGGRKRGGRKGRR